MIRLYMSSSGKSLMRTRQKFPLKIDARPRVDFQDTITFRTDTLIILGRSSSGVRYLYSTAALAGHVAWDHLVRRGAHERVKLMTQRLSLLHQIVKSRQAETTHINLAFVARSVAEVFDTTSDAHVNTIALDHPSSDHPTPDLADISPSGNRIFVSLRGPNPLSGSPHAATGSMPGLGVIQVNQGGKSGELKSVVEISNVDTTGVERADNSRYSCAAEIKPSYCTLWCEPQVRFLLSVVTFLVVNADLARTRGTIS